MDMNRSRGSSPQSQRPFYSTANEYNRNQEEKSSPSSYFYLFVIVAQLRFDTQKGGILWKIIFYNCRNTSSLWNRFYGAKYGSRTNGRADKDSDLDIFLEYKGSAREDAVFNVLHDTPIYLKDIVVDINPIKAECSGTIEEYLRRC